ncbi:MAG: carboxypeptidase regulatory-like domain-containing protein [Candidatus Hydrogenedentales bacterium]
MLGRTVSPEGMPIQNVAVLIQHPDETPRRVTTNADGVFEVDGLSGSSYTVRATVDHFNPVTAERVRPGGDLVALEMSHRSAVSGRVRDARTGAYIADFEVLYLPTPPGDDRHWAHIVHDENAAWQRISDDSGRYRIEDVYSGTAFAVGARAATYEPAFATVPPAAPGQTAEAPELVLLPETRLLGKVFGPDGQRVPGATVSLVHDGDEQAVATTDATGSFEIGGLGDGVAEINARLEGLLSDRVEIVLIRGAVVPVELRLGSGASISGTVTLDGAPVAGAEIRASRFGSFENPDASASTVSDATGAYAITGLEPADWYLVAQLPGGEAAEGQELGTTISAAEMVQQHDFTFTSSLGAIEGRILISGVPATSANIVVRPTEDWMLRNYGSTFEAGVFRVEDVVPGEVRVQVEAYGASGKVGVGSAEFNVGAGQTIHYDFLLEPAAPMRGRIINGTPEHTELAVLTGTRTQPPSLSFQEIARLQGEVLQRIAIDSDGTFQIKGLPDGDYTLFAATTSGDAENFLDNIQIQFVPLRVPGADDRVIEIRFE